MPCTVRQTDEVLTADPTGFGAIGDSMERRTPVSLVPVICRGVLPQRVVGARSGAGHAAATGAFWRLVPVPEDIAFETGYTRGLPLADEA